MPAGAGVTDPARLQQHRFEAAYEEHRLSVLRFSLAWTNDLDDAEDLTQETFDRLWKQRDTIDWSRSVEPWLITVAGRLATDRFRRLRRWRPIRTGASSSHVADVDRWLDVQRAFGRLSPLEREAIALTAVLGYDSNEAGRLLGTSPEAIRSAISRGRKKLGEMT